MAEVHAAEADGGDGEGAEGSGVHGRRLRVWQAYDKEQRVTAHRPPGRWTPWCPGTIVELIPCRKARPDALAFPAPAWQPPPLPWRWPAAPPAAGGDRCLAQPRRDAQRRRRAGRDRRAVRQRERRGLRRAAGRARAIQPVWVSVENREDTCAYYLSVAGTRPELLPGVRSGRGHGRGPSAVARPQALSRARLPQPGAARRDRIGLRADQPRRGRQASCSSTWSRAGGRAPSRSSPRCRASAPTTA